MNPLINTWLVIGNNSDQIQTILAIIGLVLAVIAALYAKKKTNKTISRSKTI
ncbi:LPXTG cell wall anchor domain-containing protein [Acinetobacter vivianii]